MCTWNSEVNIWEFSISTIRDPGMALRLPDLEINTFNPPSLLVSCSHSSFMPHNISKLSTGKVTGYTALNFQFFSVGFHAYKGMSQKLLYF